MNPFLQTLVDGIVIGSVYALIALGYTLVYGILQFINFAHSDVFTLGAWSSVTVAAAMGLAAMSPESVPWYAGLIILPASMICCAVVGLLIERFAYRPLRNAPRLNVLITAIGVSLLLQSVGQIQIFTVAQPNVGRPYTIPFGTEMRLMAPVVTESGVVDATVVVTAIVLMVLIEGLIYWTKTGLAMRAVSYDHRAAALMGVNVDRIISTTFVIGAALAGGAGFLYALKFPIVRQPAETTWVLLGLKAFVAAVVGGIGNVRGAMLGGLCIGLVEQFAIGYVSSTLSDAVVFLILIVVLLLRPAGILGKAIVEKV